MPGTSVAAAPGEDVLVAWPAEVPVETAEVVLPVTTGPVAVGAVVFDAPPALA